MPENTATIYDARTKRWLRFERPVATCATRELGNVVDTLREVEERVRADGLYAAGFISYEAGPAFDAAIAAHPPGDFPLLWFGLYGRAEPIEFPPTPSEPAPALSWSPSVSEKEYETAFHKVKGYIETGDTYQVNYSFRLRTPFAGNPWDLFVRMVHAQGYGYAGFVDTGDWTVCSASPELFFEMENGILTSRPMKGTAARGMTQKADCVQAEWLAESKKNRAENVMIVDMVRNDLGRIARQGTVETTRLFDVERYPTLWQMTSTVQCETDAGLTQTMEAFFPAASITGAPKIRTTQIIAELENAPRGIYTGTVGFLAPDGRAQFNVAIRTVAIDRTRGAAEYGIGGGIVWDSEGGDELEECYTKARILTQAMPEFALLETILWTPEEGYALLDAHMVRLTDSAAYFGRPLDIGATRESLAKTAATLPNAPHRVRLLVSRDGAPSVEAFPLSPLPTPYRVRIAPNPVSSRDPFLYHKTTHREVYERAKAEAADCDDVILWNERDEITESCIANVIVERNGRLVTPPVECGLLAGTYREKLIAEGKVAEEPVRVEELQEGAKFWLVNSVRGMWEAGLLSDA